MILIISTYQQIRSLNPTRASGQTKKLGFFVVRVVIMTPLADDLITAALHLSNIGENAACA